MGTETIRPIANYAQTLSQPAQLNPNTGDKRASCASYVLLCLDVDCLAFGYTAWPRATVEGLFDESYDYREISMKAANFEDTIMWLYYLRLHFSDSRPF